MNVSEQVTALGSRVDAIEQRMDRRFDELRAHFDAVSEASPPTSATSTA